MTLVAAVPAGIYVETSALDDFLRHPTAFGCGPFVVSEYSLAEKARLPWDAFEKFVDAVAASGALFLRAPPVTQLITGNFDPAWNGPIEYVAIDVAAVRNGRAAAVRRLGEICENLRNQFQRRYAELRPHMTEWNARVDRGNPDGLLDPRKPHNRRAIVIAAALETLHLPAAPTPDDAAAERLRFTLRAWELAMVLVRLDRERDNESDLRNDPIDAVHYALAATFCSGLATLDNGILRIRDLMPEPRCPLVRAA